MGFVHFLERFAVLLELVEGCVESVDAFDILLGDRDGGDDACACRADAACAVSFAEKSADAEFETILAFAEIVETKLGLDADEFRRC